MSQAATDDSALGFAAASSSSSTADDAATEDRCFKYVVTAQPSTAVTHALFANFTSPTASNLIVCKSNRIDIYQCAASGLVLVRELPIFGEVENLLVIRQSGRQTDSLLVTTYDTMQLFLLSYDYASRGGDVTTDITYDFYHASSRRVDGGTVVAADSGGSVIAIHAYLNEVRLVFLSPGESGRTSPMKVRFDDNISKMAVLPDLHFAVLSEKDNVLAVTVYQFCFDEMTLKRADAWKTFANIDRATSDVLAVPEPIGGLLLVGETSITYRNQSLSTLKQIGFQLTSFLAHCQIDADGTRWLLGDHTGALHLLVLAHSPAGGVTDLQLFRLGVTSIASSLAYLDNGVVFVGSTSGDSQLIRLLDELPRNGGSCFQLLDVFPNIGPITDFCAVDLDRPGLGQVVTCSGRGKDGSLRCIRNGIGLSEHARIAAPGVKGLWSLRASSSSTVAAYLVVAFVDETVALALRDSDLVPSQLPGLDHSARTLHCANMSAQQVCQVTSGAVRLLLLSNNNNNSDDDDSDDHAIDSWSPPDGTAISLAASNASHVLVATAGKHLYLVEATAAGQLRAVSSRQLDSDASALHVETSTDSDSEAPLAALGSWDSSVALLELPSLRSLARVELTGGLPRSVLLSRLYSERQLFCATGDGEFYHYSIVGDRLREEKRISMGTQPISLTPFQTKGSTHVFAASDRPMIAYAQNKKVLYSSMNMRAVAHVCAFHSDSFPNSLALVTDDELVIGAIDELQKLHIRALPLNEAPRRIAHQPSSRTFCVATFYSSFDPMEDEWQERFSLRLFDEHTFQALDVYPLKDNEQVTTLVSCSYSAGSSGRDRGVSVFVVGTSFVLPREPEPSSGRILVFAVEAGRLSLAAETTTSGGVNCICPFDDLLAVCVSNRLCVYRYATPAADGALAATSDDDEASKIQLIASRQIHILALVVVAAGDVLIVGDLIKSLTAFRYSHAKRELESPAHDWGTLWITALAALDDKMYIAAEQNGNLVTFARGPSSTDAAEPHRLRRVGDYHVGDFINTIRHGSLVMPMPDAPRIPTLLYATIHGAVGVVASIGEQLFNFLARVQLEVAKAVAPVGQLSHAKYRAFRVDGYPPSESGDVRGFLDGDLIELYLELAPDTQQRIAAAVGSTTAHLQKTIEGLQQSLH